MTDYQLHRRPLVAALIKDAPDLIVVAGLGSAAWDITAAGDRDLNFPLWGAMGGAVSVGLGIALAQPHRRVVVVTGDGESGRHCALLDGARRASRKRCAGVAAHAGGTAVLRCQGAVRGIAAGAAAQGRRHFARAIPESAGRRR